MTVQIQLIYTTKYWLLRGRTTVARWDECLDSKASDLRSVLSGNINPLQTKGIYIYFFYITPKASIPA